MRACPRLLPLLFCVSVLTGCVGGGGDGDSGSGADTTAPAINSFSLPATSSSLNVPVSAFLATDNVAVTGFLISTTSAAPSASAGGWSSSAPSTYTFAAAGSYTAYAWVKDAAGNVSASKSATVTITQASTGASDTVAPLVSAFTLPSSASSLVVPVTAFSASDATGVSGYLITNTPIAPSASAAGWTSSVPTSFNAPAAGVQTAYAWAKDAAGNVSAGVAATVTITLASGTSNVASHPYYRMTVGSTIAYTDGSAEKVVQNTGETVVIESFEGGTRESLMTLKVDGLSVGAESTRQFDAQGTQTGVLTFSPPLELFPPSTAVGNTRVQDVAMSNGTNTVTTRCTLSVEAIETVTAGAKSYPDSIRVKHTCANGSINRRIWFAPDFGPVKMQDLSSGEMSEIMDSATSGSTPSGGGTIPAALVGRWYTADGGVGTAYTFNSDGSYLEVDVLGGGSGSCLAIKETTFLRQGTFGTSGSTLVLNQSSGTYSITYCYSQPEPPSPVANQKETITFTWSISGNVLTLVGETGTRRFTRY